MRGLDGSGSVLNNVPQVLVDLGQCHGQVTDTPADVNDDAALRKRRPFES